MSTRAPEPVCVVSFSSTARCRARGARLHPGGGSGAHHPHARADPRRLRVGVEDATRRARAFEAAVAGTVEPAGYHDLML